MGCNFSSETVKILEVADTVNNPSAEAADTSKIFVFAIELLLLLLRVPLLFFGIKAFYEFKPQN